MRIHTRVWKVSGCLQVHEVWQWVHPNVVYARRTWNDSTLAHDAGRSKIASWVAHLNCKQIQKLTSPVTMMSEIPVHTEEISPTSSPSSSISSPTDAKSASCSGDPGGEGSCVQYRHVSSLWELGFPTVKVSYRESSPSAWILTSVYRTG